MSESSRATTLKLFVVVAAWAATFRILVSYGARLLPLGLARELSLQGFLAGVNLLTAAFGCTLAFLLLDEPRPLLGLTAARPGAIVRAGLWALPVFVLTSYVAVGLALPTLLEEIRARGVDVVREASGEFGRQLLGAPALLTLVWGALIAPISEELFFRGAFYGLIENLLAPKTPDAIQSSERLPEGVLETGGIFGVARALRRYFLSGGLATLVSALVFAWLHADMPGGMGIVRVTSALGLGLAAGIARHAGRSVFPALVLHVLFNLASIATARRWVVSGAFPTKLMVPTLLTLLAALCLLVLGALFWLGRRRRTAG